MTTILITGTNRGLGLEFVKQYATEGVQVIAACRAPSDALKAVAQGAHGQVEILQLDVADHASITAARKAVGDRKLDVLINNAGIYGPKDQSLQAMDYDAWATTFAVNTMAPLAMMQAFRDAMVAGGKIISITSIMGSIARSTSQGFIAYRASKAALNMVVKMAALELAREKITAIALHPGWVKTDMGGPNADLEIPFAITQMRKTIAGVTAEKSGLYLNYDGTALPW